MSLRPRARGLTLLEVVLSFTLLALALALLAQATLYGLRRLSRAEGRLEMQQSLRTAMAKVIEELRWAEAVVADGACSGLCPDRVTARVAPDNPRRPGEAYVVRFQHDPAARELERVFRATTPLAGSIARVAFAYADADGLATTVPDRVVRVDVMLESVARPDGGTYALSTAAYLRAHVRPPLPTPAPPSPRPSPGASRTPAPEISPPVPPQPR